jgi:glycosyltransferase involved in cell wall biosynthesis
VRLAYVVQRYGPEIRGGAEAHCRDFATRVAARGHSVEVFTTCATDYRTWRNEFPAGRAEDDGVAVTRFPVVAERPDDFDVLCDQVLGQPSLAPRDLQEHWMRMQGPEVPELVETLRSSDSRFDLVIFVTYLYYTTYFGLPAVKQRAVLHPTAHDEAPIYLSMFEDMFEIPRALVFLTPEEREFVRHRFDLDGTPDLVSGIGIEGPKEVSPDRARDRLGIDGPFVLYVGRLDPQKGIEQLCGYFARYRERRGAVVDLVLAGDVVMDVPPTAGISVLGTVTDQEKWDALAAATALVHPSRHESFALILLESWCVETPSLVNAYSEVMAGHSRRSGGGLWYRTYADFEACLDRLLTDPELATGLGRQGKLYVETNYDWDGVIDRYLSFLERVRARLP